MKVQEGAIPPTLVVRRVIHARREKVFEAWTKPELMQQWFYPGVGRAEVSNTLKVGGKFSNKMILEGSGGCSDEKCCPEEYPHHGEYLEIVPPERIVFTWNSHLVTNSKVTVMLRDVGDATELTLTHELLETEDLRQKHSDGWEGCLANLGSYLG